MRSDRMVISTPLGQGLAELTSNVAGAQLETADRRSFAAADVDALSEEAFGARLPLSRLPRWVLGQTGEAAVGLRLDPRGRPSGFTDDGWNVIYMAYEDDAPDALPTLIRLHRDTLDVKLKVDRWTIDP